MIYFVLFFPLAAAFFSVWIGRSFPKGQGIFVVCATGAVLLGMGALCATQFGASFTIPYCHLSFTLDGFRCVYGVIAAFMWFASSLLSQEYFLGQHQLNRYYFFFLLTLSATLGVFLSADLYTTFLFFEMMSLCSYVWVVQDETPAAIDAGKTYLTIAVLGGLVTLMGLFILYHLTGTMEIAALQSACAAVTDRGALWAAAFCVFFGFAAKAGVFPLHIWLPKAHPVAPAPASALLSGVLTKAGLFGVFLVTAQMLPHDIAWGDLILTLGTITMVLGAVIAVFSNNLKYILACSSLSQIGFVMTGIAMTSLLGEENALAANGAVLYMMNHSLVKLTLFLFAGVVYMNTHALDLNQIRGFGRGRPLLHIVFLCGACSLAGIPGFCGYLSKTLVHESLVEYAHLSGSWAVTGVEWLFLFSGGLTAAYLFKIYVALFWQGAPKRAHFHAGSRPMTMAALLLSAVALPVLGLLPHRLAERVTALTLPFTGGHPFAHPVSYFAWVNLRGVVISLGIGALVYGLFICRVLMQRQDGEPVYLSLWPEKFSLDEGVYRPFFTHFLALLSVVTRAFCDTLDLLVLFMRKTLLRDSHIRINQNRYSALVRSIAKTSPLNEAEVSDRVGTFRDTASRITNSLSFGLLMTCLGLCAILLCEIFYVFG
ncbi:MAG: proton-conducting transporter membrane subunit [Oscillibacter sp.]|nr:proton-conducting transporter membrane subunit [Oscillibacter sp.]